MGGLIQIADTSIWVERRGRGFPLFLLHGGPGDDHTEFADYLDPLGDAYELLLVDMRAQGSSAPADPSTWTIQHMAADIDALADAMELERFAVLGHSYGAFVALYHAVERPGAATATIVSHGLPSARYLEGVEDELARFEPIHLREQVAASWERESEVETPEQMAQLMADQWPFHFKNPEDPRIAGYMAKTRDTRYAPDVLKQMSANDYGGLEVEDRLAGVTQPTLVLTGRAERTCPAAGAEAIAAGIPGAELVVFENSAHMSFVEEPELYLEVVRDFLDRSVG
jgi:proline iminopeptidase